MLNSPHTKRDVSSLIVYEILYVKTIALHFSRTEADRSIMHKLCQIMNKVMKELTDT